MDGETVEAIGERRARRAAGLVVGAEHEVIDEQLRTAVEQIVERRRAVLGVEPVGLVHAPTAAPRDAVRARRYGA
jgi:triosephosphate isomerase